jgi:asparagine synthase (glutamine-hydrolysing)
MCGITGVVECGERRTLDLMNRALAHRGPDDEGIEWFADAGSGLGHRRLSILDLSPAGHQPMCNDSRTLWIVLNGEIYNYREIRRELEGKGYTFRSNSDTEVLVKAYEQWDEACLQKLNGMYAFIIYDTTKRELFAARDRIGVKPLYYTETKEGLVAASEIKAILATGLVEKRPDYVALHTPTRFQISPSTGFEGIRKLPPGHVLRFSGGRLTVRKYWEVTPTEDFAGNEEKAKETLDALLQDAVRLQMIADVPVGVFLSGGLDSSIISALMRKNTEGDIHAFTIKFSDADQQFEKMPNDSFFARKVADQFKLRHHEFKIHADISELLPKLVWHLDEPLADPAAINTYLISKAARELGITVLLNGMGGDEIFGGYRKQLACLHADTYQSVVPGVVRSLIEGAANRIPVATASRGVKTIRWTKRFLSFASLSRAERFMMADLSLSREMYGRCFANGTSYDDTLYYRRQAETLRRDSVSYLTNMCLSDTLFFLPEHNLLYSDKASMAVGVEGRPPLTDHRIVEFLFTLPPQYRIHGRTQKYLLKEVAGKYLPHEIVHRPKAPFGAPLRSWVKGPLAPMVSDVLSEESVKRRGLYNPTFVSMLIKRDRDGMEDNGLMIWTLLTNEIWFRTFFDS